MGSVGRKLTIILGIVLLVVLGIKTAYDPIDNYSTANESAVNYKLEESRNMRKS